MTKLYGKKITRLLANREAYTIGSKSRVALSDVAEDLKVIGIDYSSGTSGVEYIIEFEDGRLLQLRGCMSFTASWEKVDD